MLHAFVTRLRGDSSGAAYAGLALATALAAAFV